MKTLISYVVQDAKEHFHKSDILETQSPPYSFSSDPPIHEVMEWAKRKQNELPKDQELVILNTIKL